VTDFQSFIQKIKAILQKCTKDVIIS